MAVHMLGIDHERASIDTRAKFSFTKSRKAEAMQEICRLPGVCGCVILSTCNRMELWLSTQEDWNGDLPALLCSLKGEAAENYRDCFQLRSSEEAVSHLFSLTAGLKSQIFGEDQILTQVGDALTEARMVCTTDRVLEVLFRMAVTVGKRIRTEIPMVHGNASVIDPAIQRLKQSGVNFRGLRCLVLGNGMMGKAAAQALLQEGAEVTVTIRQYTKGIVDVPKGAGRIMYGDRMDFIPSCDLVVSATASPNLTLTREGFSAIRLTKPLILIDLAVPRDIDPALQETEGIRFYDMESFREEGLSEEQKEERDRALVLIAAQIEEFFGWYSGKDQYERINRIKEETAEDLLLRIGGPLQRSELGDHSAAVLSEEICESEKKVINKLIYTLKNRLDDRAFEEVLEALEEAFGKEEKG